LVALIVASRPRPGVPHLLVGGAAMGGAIVGMHYIGMAAMHLGARPVWDPWLVALSVVIAVGGSIVAIRLTLFFRAAERELDLRKIGSAVAVGAVIVTMHFTGMAAAQFVAVPHPTIVGHWADIPPIGIAAITALTLLVLGVVILLSRVDRRLGAQSQQLQASQERYQAIFERSLAGYYHSTLDGRLLECNLAYAQIFGYGSAAECTRAMVSDVYFDPQGREAFVAALRESGVLPNLETRLRRKDGSAIWVLENAILLPGVNGAPDTIEGNLLDISRRKGMDEAMTRATAAAESANRAKSDFLANMSHEIRTPMNGVIGMAELALQTDLTGDQREYLEVIKLSADALLGVINDILDFSKIEAGKLDIDPIEFDLNATMDDLVRSLAPRAHQKGLELAYHLTAGTPTTLVGDPGRLRQILVNLVGNAIKFTSKGEVVLRVATQSASEGRATLTFTIQDTGIGIAADKQALVFDAFTQADSSTTRHFGGTGLGLTISAHLVDLMEGRVWVESELGIGSTFHVTLPFGVVAERTARVIPRDLADLRGVPILVVDDNATNRRILDEILVNWGLKPTLVDSGRTAIQTMERAIKAGHRFELVLLDFQMPEMDGFQVAEEIKRHPELGTTTIMMLSSVGERGDGQRCRELGVAAYLTKPVRQSVLLDAILLVFAQTAAGPLKPADLVTRHTLREEHRHLRILLAEDNQVNQLVATRILEKRGHTVVVVENGREALAALDRATFDLILMDVQMPVMDGREATLAIREGEQTRGGHIPIIAVTASAMKGDRDKCFACG
ncbi:MAG: response regulator, partial [Actinomycetota bacterium]|nr:response regulator [Actinomycetota bacterium]